MDIVMPRWDELDDRVRAKIAAHASSFAELEVLERAAKGDKAAITEADKGGHMLAMELYSAIRIYLAQQHEA